MIMAFYGINDIIVNPNEFFILHLFGPLDDIFQPCPTLLSQNLYSSLPNLTDSEYSISIFYSDSDHDNETYSDSDFDSISLPSFLSSDESQY